MDVGRLLEIGSDTGALHLLSRHRTRTGRWNTAGCCHGDVAWGRCVASGCWDQPDPQVVCRGPVGLFIP